MRLSLPIAGEHAAAGRPRVQRRELADDVAIADLETARLAPILEILRLGADARELEDAVLGADRRVAVEDGMRSDGRALADAHVRADHRVGTDPDARPEDRTRCHDRGRVHDGGHGRDLVDCEIALRDDGRSDLAATTQAPVSGRAREDADVDVEDVARDDGMTEADAFEAA